MKILNSILISLLAFFSIANVNLFGNFSVIDLLLLSYIIATALSIGLKIDRNTFLFIVIGNISLFCSAIFLIFSNHPVQSFLYLSQLWFIITIVPLFYQSLIIQDRFQYFLKLYLRVFIIISIAFLTFGIFHFTKGLGKFWIFGLAGVHRITYGDTLVSNDLGIFLITGFLLINEFIKKDKIKLLFFIFFSFVYILTLSKTIALVLILFWGYYYRKYLLKVLVGAILIIIILMPLFDNIPRIDRLTQFSNGGGGRLVKIQEALTNYGVFIFPMHGQEENQIISFQHGGQSIHNFILNLFVNIGLFQASLILIPAIIAMLWLFFKKKIDEKEKIIVLILFLQICVISLNAFMLTRAIWVAIFLVIYFYKYYNQNMKQSKNENTTYY